jgi:hypothetical protein
MCAISASLCHMRTGLYLGVGSWAFSLNVTHQVRNCVMELVTRRLVEPLLQLNIAYPAFVYSRSTLNDCYVIQSRTVLLSFLQSSRCPLELIPFSRIVLVCRHR